MHGVLRKEANQRMDWIKFDVNYGGGLPICGLSDSDSGSVGATPKIPAWF